MKNSDCVLRLSSQHWVVLEVDYRRRQRVLQVVPSVLLDRDDWSLVFHFVFV